MSHLHYHSSEIPVYSGYVVFFNYMFLVCLLLVTDVFKIVLFAFFNFLYPINIYLHLKFSPSCLGVLCSIQPFPTIHPWMPNPIHSPSSLGFTPLIGWPSLSSWSSSCTFTIPLWFSLPTFLCIACLFPLILSWLTCHIILLGLVLVMIELIILHSYHLFSLTNYVLVCIQACQFCHMQA